MKKCILSFAILFVLLVAFCGCSSNLITTSTSLSSKISNIPPQKSSQTSSTLGNIVSIDNFKFSPDSITIKIGDAIEWKNNDSVKHTIVFDTFESPAINKGDSYKHIFDTAGVFNYICGIHPSMKGKVEVK